MVWATGGGFRLMLPDELRLRNPRIWEWNVERTSAEFQLFINALALSAEVRLVLVSNKRGMVKPSRETKTHWLSHVFLVDSIPIDNEAIGSKHTTPSPCCFVLR